MFYGVPVGWAIWYMISSSLKNRSKHTFKIALETIHRTGACGIDFSSFWGSLLADFGLQDRSRKGSKMIHFWTGTKTSQIFCSLRLDTVCRRRSSRPDVQLRRSSHRRRFWLPMWPGCGPKLDLKSAKSRSQNKWCFRSTFGPDSWSVCCNSVPGPF